MSPSNRGNIDPQTGMGHPICSAGHAHPPAPLLPHADKPFSINYAVKQLPWRGCSNRRKGFVAQRASSEISEARGADGAVCACEQEAPRGQPLWHILLKDRAAE